MPTLITCLRVAIDNCNVQFTAGTVWESKQFKAGARVASQIKGEITKIGRSCIKEQGSLLESETCGFGQYYSSVMS